MNTVPNEEESFLEEIAPTLFQKDSSGKIHKLGLPSAPPAGYFKSMNRQVMGRIHGLPSASAAPRTVKYVNMRNLALAAAIAVIVALVPIVRHMGSGGVPTEIQPALADAHENLWFDFLGDEELFWELAEPIHFALAALPEDLTAEDIENYLMDENIPEEWIIDEIN